MDCCETRRAEAGAAAEAGRCGTMTHDDRRRGTTTLFAALNALEGSVIGRCMQRHRHEEFIRFLNTVEREVPAGKVIEAIVDNYATHKHAKVKAWLARHPRWTFHFTPELARLPASSECVRALALLWQNVSEWDSRIGVSVIHGWSAVWEPTMVRRVLDWHDRLA
jgi:transposase